MSTAGVVAFVAGTDAIAIEGGSTIGHCCRPLTNNHPVIDIGGVFRRIAANVRAVVLEEKSVCKYLLKLIRTIGAYNS